MKKTSQKTIVTSALPYVNNVPHLGTLVCVLSADVYSRYLKLKKEDAISVCGTDEHGTTAEVKALEEGLTPRQLVDKYFKIHRRIYEWFECDFDCFGRTSSEENKEITIDIFNKLDKNGYIKEETIEQCFCPKCSKFLADRFIEGECPYCGYKNARGDQCENCGKLLNATELVCARCKTCGTEPIVKESRHLFIDLPKLAPKLKTWIKKAEKKWSENAKTMTAAWLKEGLKPRCITRDLEWGIKVPKKGFENKVFYSWFDAPIGYIGITKEAGKDWKKYWLDPKTRLVQFMGKDNIPFHTILFPAFLIGTGDKYALVSGLSVNEYLNYETGKFSKSRNEGVFGDDAIETGIPADVWRYYILVNRPEKTDTVFDWRDFQSKINNELVANIGNLVNRTIVFINNFFDGKISKAGLRASDKDFFKKIEREEKKALELLDKIELKESLKQIMSISKFGNQYFQEKEPWKTKDKAALYVLANFVKDLAILISPFMPAASASIKKQLNIEKLELEDLGKLSLKEGHRINKSELLFHKLEDKQREEFQKKFSGKKKTIEEKSFPLNLRVAKIIEAKNHPNADKLVVLKIALGDEERQLVAGIRKHYSNDELKNKNIVVVSNLKPAVLRGIESNGMLLAADDGKDLKLLEAPNSESGDIVFIDGYKNTDKEITFDEFLKIKLAVKNKKVVFEDKVLKTKKEEINADVEDGAIVR
ncbi:MAG: methionine--tRNA ligase [Candidatus Woesearchaeota archaeon]|nr:methionine--tRNA ligase [Candidatus Woesearchaeota archaeon]